MRIEICNEKECTGCAACANVCPKNCILMVEDKDGFYYPVIDEEKCILCGACSKVCPNNKTFPKNEASFFMAIHKDKDVLRRSSSGGAFTALANLILQRNGVVIGAFMDKKDNTVKHTAIDSIDELDVLRRSKYYQSVPGNIYKKAIEELKCGRYVLFSGTACQIAALYSMVPPQYLDKLITVDVLCHGVTSKKVVDAYIKSEEKRFGKRITDYQFRVKESWGWHSGGGTKMKLTFDDGSYFVHQKSIDSFFLSFNNNVALRESCYQCNYCGTNRIADFTIADFWGVTEKRADEQKQQDGISLLLCNSDKAILLLNDLMNDLEITQIDSQEAIPYNNALTAPNSRPKNRNLFFSMINSDVDFNRIIKMLYWKTQLKVLIKRMLGPNIVEKIKRMKKSVKI